MVSLLFPANPVDILTTLTQKLSGFPKNRVIGTGTSLDSMRLRVELSKRLNVPVAKVNSMVLGEHGDTSFENFDESTVAVRHSVITQKSTMMF